VDRGLVDTPRVVIKPATSSLYEAPRFSPTTIIFLQLCPMLLLAYHAPFFPCYFDEPCRNRELHLARYFSNCFLLRQTKYANSSLFGKSNAQSISSNSDSLPWRLGGSPHLQGSTSSKRIKLSPAVQSSHPRSLGTVPRPQNTWYV
jgi:hypothetical protein